MKLISTYKNIILSILIYLLFILISIPANSFASVEDIILEGDRFFKNKFEKGSLHMAIDKYLAAESQNPFNVDVKWKLGEAYFWLGKTSNDKKTQKDSFKSGASYSKKGVELKIECVECHFWFGVNLAKFGEAEGIIESITMIKEVMKEMEKVIDLNPSFSWGGGHRVIGRIYYKLPWFLGGDKEKAYEHLEKAIRFGPEYPLNILFFADSLIDLKRYKKAKTELKRLIHMTFKDNKPDNKEIYRQATALLDKIR